MHNCVFYMPSLETEEMKENKGNIICTPSSKYAKEKFWHEKYLSSKICKQYRTFHKLHNPWGVLLKLLPNLTEIFSDYFLYHESYNKSNT